MNGGCGRGRKGKRGRWSLPLASQFVFFIKLCQPAELFCLLLLKKGEKKKQREGGVGGRHGENR